MTRTRTLAAVILAAVKGTRLRSTRPKVLHPICGRPALWHVAQAALAASPRPDRDRRRPRSRRVEIEEMAPAFEHGKLEAARAVTGS
jgi:molybdopterin-guanine dinucleotide biosynthesis protein A